jgi:hypothetical protein
MVAMNRCGGNNEDPPPYDDGYGDEGEDHHFFGMMDTGAESYVDGFIDGIEEKRKDVYIIGGALLAAGLGFGMVIGMWMAR